MAVTPNAVTLVVSAAGAAAQRVVMGKPVLSVGRGAQVDLPVREGAVSTKHAEFTIEEGRLFVRDLNSSNGTYVNGNRVMSSALANGDVVRLGSQATITVEIAQPQPGPTRR